MRIRAATEQDATAIAALWTEAYVTLGAGGRSKPYAEADFFDSARHGEVFVAGGQSEIAGAVVLSAPGAPGRLVAEPDEAELSRLAVASSMRGMGLGRGLAELCSRRARAAEWAAIALWSRPGQVEAHRLYRALGYRRAPERDSVDATGQARVVFRLVLRSG